MANIKISKKDNPYLIFEYYGNVRKLQMAILPEK